MINLFYSHMLRLSAAVKGGRWLWLGILLLCVVIGACTQERQPCLTPKTASFRLRCVHYTSDSAAQILASQDTSLPRAFFGSLTGNGLNTVVYTAPTAYFTISLSSAADSCQYRFKADSATAQYDTLSFYYQRKLQFLSNACGYTYFYALDSAHTTHYNVDSVLITNTSITNDVNTTHLKIFIKRNF